MNRITASRTALLLQCHGAPNLPWVQTTSAAAEDGTRKHAIMDRRGIGLQAWYDRLDTVPECRTAWDAFGTWLNEHQICATEQTIAWETGLGIDLVDRTALEWQPPAGSHRAYDGIAPHVLAGTADLIATGTDADEREVLIVCDWKFGQELVSADAPQLRTLLAAAAKRRPNARAIALVVQVPHGAGSGAAWGGRAHVSWVEYTHEELEDHVDALAIAHADAATGTQTLTPGPECKYCPAQLACPAQLDAMVRVIHHEGPVTLDRAGQIWLELRQAKKRLELIEERIKAMADQPAGIPLPNGKTLAMVDRTRASVDAKALEAVARFHGASDEEIDGCRTTTAYRQAAEVKR